MIKIALSRYLAKRSLVVAPHNAVRLYSNAQFPGGLNEPPQQTYFHQYTKAESDIERRARLVYQSRKRGNLENGILLSTFADQYLDKLDSKQLATYDTLINLPDNEWDIYYWVTGAQEVPEFFRSDVFDMLCQHVRNSDKVMRNQQPPLKPKL